MKISELLQKIIDLSDGDDTAFDDEVEPTGVFMPPLQTNIELMKKAANVDNVIDDESEEIAQDDAPDCGCSDDSEWQTLQPDSEDPLLAIRRIAGIDQPQVISSQVSGPGF